MYSNLILGFGIGWCLAYVICIIYLARKSESKESAGDGGKKTFEGLTLLVSNISDVKKQYSDTRIDQLKNLGNAFSRNPKAFNYDYQTLVKEPESKLKSIDNQIEDILKKCESAILNIKDKPISEGGSPEQPISDKKFVFVNAIGIFGIVLANLLYFIIKI